MIALLSLQRTGILVGVGGFEGFLAVKVHVDALGLHDGNHVRGDPVEGKIAL